MNEQLQYLIYATMPTSDMLYIPEENKERLECYFNLNIHYDLPGTHIEKAIHTKSVDNHDLIYSKLLQSCRKLCMMWYSSEQAIEAESEFYSFTCKESPTLFGEDAIKINYHLESFVMIARSALDVASGVFGYLLPLPFQGKRYDSFNKLIKDLEKLGDNNISNYFKELRKDESSWLSIVSGHEKGRSLRDKIAHQIEFPIEYMELNPPSEKESAIVVISKTSWMELYDFINNLRVGVIEGFTVLESLCYGNIIHDKTLADEQGFSEKMQAIIKKR